MFVAGNGPVFDFLGDPRCADYVYRYTNRLKQLGNISMNMNDFVATAFLIRPKFVETMAYLATDIENEFAIAEVAIRHVPREERLVEEARHAALRLALLVRLALVSEHGDV